MILDLLVIYLQFLLYHNEIFTTKEHNRNTKEEKNSIIVHKREFSILKIITFVAFCDLLWFNSY